MENWHLSSTTVDCSDAEIDGSSLSTSREIEGVPVSAITDFQAQNLALQGRDTRDNRATTAIYRWPSVELCVKPIA
ncbi:hypothetical protein ACFFQF_22175 [Haladaptatus pallidirubidus]|uniref:hypothetical protein n=1 Tax=Haladaptatus pallidirubidus TaxID=1008152 RepID=UPI001D11DB7D|nr:hypothetical protein [Haladaptatus pallidirubidus]